MKTIKHTLLILLVSTLIISCGNSGTTETSNSQMTEKKQGTDAVKTAEEEAGNTVEKATYLWQKNILWFFYQKVSQ
jgi:hypothetical protein